eukprot:2123335-Pyramimonas_sp.AAC.1
MKTQSGARVLAEDVGLAPIPRRSAGCLVGSTGGLEGGGAPVRHRAWPSPVAVDVALVTAQLGEIVSLLVARVP